MRGLNGKNAKDVVEDGEKDVRKEKSKERCGNDRVLGNDGESRGGNGGKEVKKRTKKGKNRRGKGKI